ncbi:unnamed protein product [Bemisia tabaci]|uniref:Period circadian protein n=1 Tax=Bemisia tabaci TaxID=7038 RepID=A0A9P0FZI3_BEMTA|nr:unnamed protein product [Bemisia tabaci]
MEETASSSNTKVSNDSAYSTCSNSQSRRSGSSKSHSHHSTTSSTSSGYGGHPSSSTLGSGSNDQLFPEPAKKSKVKDHKKKKIKSSNTTSSSTVPTPPTSTPTINEATSSEELSASSQVKSTPPDSVLSSIINNGATPSAENESLQMAALSQTLLCFKKMKNKELHPPDLQTSNIDEEQFIRSNQKNDESFKSYVETSVKEKEFCVVVSMHDGIVLYTSSGLTDVLGFHKDMWLGRSFTDFVHPKDRIAFVSHVTSGVTKPFLDNQFSADASSSSKHNAKNSTFYCHLRCYRGLKSSGFNIIDRDVKYIACQFTLSFKEIVANSESSCFLNSPHGIFSVINVQPVFSAYTSSNEVINSPKFMTRHSANGVFCHVDSLVVSYLGYLPQDMMNHSIFNFYCSEDLPMLRDVYKEVMSEQGHLVASKPYKFKCQNGSFAVIETEWSTFINPWTKNLEFVIGQHKVIQGPADVDVTVPSKTEDSTPETDSQAELLKKEILEILQKPVNASNRVVKVQVSKRCRDLASFIETLVEEITKPETKNDTQKDANVSERDSVMLGEISPHHEYGSKVSSETPPSYTQLNYNENIQRFFQSQPKTSFSDGTSENKIMNSTPETSEGNEESSSSNPSNSKDRPCENVQSASSSSRSSKGSSRNAKTYKKSKINYQPPPLTEEMLSRHNEDMEKQMVINHRAQRGKMLKVKAKPQDRVDDAHGVKRSGSHSWDNGPYRRSMKQIHGNDQPHDTNRQNNRRSVVTVTMQSSIGNAYNPPEPSSISNFTYWPMFSYNGPMLQHMDHNESVPTSVPAVMGPGMHPGLAPGMPAVMPVATPSSLPPYYIPREQQIRPEHAGPPFPPFTYIATNQAYVMSPMIHPNWPGYSPMIYAPCPVIPPLSNLGSKSGMTPSSDFNRPVSRATSVKAEPGSARSSFILMQSDASRKGGHLSVSPNNYNSNVFPGGKDNAPGGKEESGEFSFSETGDESSYYSSFYSFLKTEEKMDDSMRSSSGDDVKKYEDELWGILNGTNDDEGKKCLRRGPTWLEGVDITPELQFRYQISTKGISDVLQADMKALAKLNQPDMVNEQLSTLYLELEGIYNSLKLEDSSSSGEEGTSNKPRKRKPFNYDKMVMIFEEEAPLPPPVTTAIPVSVTVTASGN